MMKPCTSLCILLASLVGGCGVYTFTGSTLPAYLKTVDIPLFVNQSLQPDVAENITVDLTSRVTGDNQLRVVTGRGDATISGTVTSYVNSPRSYGNVGIRTVDITEYAVAISVDVEFVDNKKGDIRYKGTITGEGIYDFKTQTEALGRSLAIKQIVNQIIQNSIQSW